MKNTCPVCNYDGLFEPPYDSQGYGSYEICPCCGFQFGYDDYPDTEQGIRNWKTKWIEGGSLLYSKTRIPTKDDE